jgi:uncharacterized membrane protein YczE
VTTAADDARFGEVLAFPSARELRRRLPPLVLGLSLLGFAIAMSVRAELGVAPWDVFHQGVADATGLSFGLVVVLTGLVVLGAWIPLRQRMGIGTVLNTLSIGFIADLGLAVIPTSERLLVRVSLLVGALVLFGAGGGLYIGSGLGPGPRDGLMTAITARGHRLWRVRTVMECTVLAAGYAFGGKVGVGTVLLALAIGPATHAGLARFHLPVRAAPEVLGE